MILLLLITAICPIAIAYSMRQIIKSVCVCHLVCQSVCIRHISWSIFTKIGTNIRTPKSKNEFVGGQYRTEIFALLRKSGSRNRTMTSYFRPEVEIRPFRACAMKNAQYNPNLWPNRRNFRNLRKSRSMNVTSDFWPEVEKYAI